MSMTVNRKQDTRIARKFHKILADIPGGVAVNVAVLGGEYLYEGTPITAASSGICSVCKFAKVVTQVANDATAIEVGKNSHFKIGDIVLASVGAKAHTITAIDKTNTAKDVITIDTTLGEVVGVGAYIYEAAAVSTTTTSALKNVAQSLIGTGGLVIADTNFITDAVIIGVTIGNDVPALYKATLTGIINI